MRIYQLRKELAYLDELIDGLNKLGYAIDEITNGYTNEYYGIKLIKDGKELIWFQSVEEFIIGASTLIAASEVEK